MKIHLFYVGKPRDEHANSLADEYVRRIGRFARMEMREIHPERFDPWQKHPSASKILLDPAGKRLDSPAFSQFISRSESEGRDLLFIVGGAEGHPPGWRERANMLLSLSAMTFPHELARVMLAEQLYRAFTMLRGHPYPR